MIHDIDPQSFMMRMRINSSMPCSLIGLSPLLRNINWTELVNSYDDHQQYDGDDEYGR